MFKKLLLTVVVFLSAAAAKADSDCSVIPVGSKVPCIMLNQLMPDGTEGESCYTERLKPEHKFTVVTFMSITCSYCIAELPLLNKLAGELSSVATVREVSLEKKRYEKDVRQFYAQKRSVNLMNYPLAMDVENKVKKVFTVDCTPTTYVIDANSTVVYRTAGELDAQTVAEIKAVVGLKP